MIRVLFFKKPSIKCTFKKELNFRQIKYITCWYRPPRKKISFRQNKFCFLDCRTPINNVYVRLYCDYPSHFKVTLPALSPTMENGTIISWEKKEGDKLNEGDLLAEIETDKATMGFETPEEGFLAKILVPAGTKNVPIGKLVCIIVSNKEDVDAFKNYVHTESLDNKLSAPKSPEVKESSASVPPPPSFPPPPSSLPSSPLPSPPFTTSTTSQSRVFVSPLAKKLANELGLPLEQISSGSGVYNSIKANDLKNLKVVNVQKSPLGNQAFEDVTLSDARNIMAPHNVKSTKAVPHFYLSVDIMIDNTIAMRDKINSLKEKDGIKLSLNDFIIKATALACKEVPEANSSWKDSFIRRFNNVDINITTSTDNGVVTSILFGADSKGLSTISSDMKILLEKAKEGTLKPHEFQAGTISVANLGMYGVNNFYPIIHPSQACFLAIGASEKRIIPYSQSEKGFKVSEYLSVSLSCDHRILDGAVGAQWIAVFQKFLENPDLMLL